MHARPSTRTHRASSRNGGGSSQFEDPDRLVSVGRNRSILALAMAVVACGPKALQGSAGSDDESSAADDGPAGSMTATAVEGGDPSGAADATGPAQDTGTSLPDVGTGHPVELLWERTYDGETHNRDVGLCVTMPDESTIVVGGLEVLDPFGAEFRSWLARLDGDGNVLWLDTDDRAHDETVATTDSGRVLTAGTAGARPQGTGWLMVAGSHTADGVEEWSIGEPGAGAYGVAAIGEDAIAVGMTAGIQPIAWITRRDALGEEVYTISGAIGTGAVAVVADADTLLIAGVDVPEGGDVYGTWIWTYDATTAEQVAAPGYFEGVSPMAIDRDANGAVLLTVGPDAVQVARLQDSGIEWADTFGDVNSFQFEWDMTLDAAGNIVVAGSLHGEEPGAHLRKYTPEGRLTWTRTYWPGAEIEVNGVATAPSGEIVAVGSIRNTESDSDIWVSRWSP
jgi:hypothetical protein